MRFASIAAAALVLGLATAPAGAHDISAKSDSNVPPPFDITGAAATTDGRLATFILEVTGQAGAQTAPSARAHPLMGAAP